MFVFGCLSQLASGQIQIEATVSCPECRPVLGCGICWETKEQADECVNDRASGDINVSNNLIISPNPSNGEFRITYNKEISGTIQFIDQTGRVVKVITSNNSKTNQMTVSGANFSPGLYFIKYFDANTKHNITKKLVIE